MQVPGTEPTRSDMNQEEESIRRAVLSKAPGESGVRVGGNLEMLFYWSCGGSRGFITTVKMKSFEH